MTFEIGAVQPNNIFRVNAVQMYENRHKNNDVKNMFNSGLFAQQLNENYNLNHPLVKGSQIQAKNLDLLA